MIEQKLVLKTSDCPNGDTILSLRNTKAVKVEIDALEKSAEVTTWSSMVRIVVSWLEPYLTNLVNEIGIDEFTEKYIKIFERKLKYTNIKLNNNCPVGIFKDNEIEEFISSSVYLNNKNHKLRLFDYGGHSWYVCAVYTGEIIFVLLSLIELIENWYKEKDFKKGVFSVSDMLETEITYLDRETLENDDTKIIDEELDTNELQQTYDAKELERDLIGISLQMKELILNTYKMALKYDLDKAEDIIRGTFAEDMPSDIANLNK